VLDHRVVKELDTLAQDVRQRFLRISELIEQHGLSAMREPHVKHLAGKLWEMRMKGRDGIARAIYVTARGERVVVLHAFTKKSQKTPRSALEIARTRAREVT
jgi:phage-related protein